MRLRLRQHPWTETHGQAGGRGNRRQDQGTPKRLRLRGGIGAPRGPSPASGRHARFYLSSQRMLEDKRNIWTSELIYIFGRAAFPFLKRSERAPYPELGGEDWSTVLMRQEVQLWPRRAGAGAPPSLLPWEIFVYMGGREDSEREDKPDLGNKTRPRLGWDLQGASSKARCLPASTHSRGASQERSCNLRVLLVGALSAHSPLFGTGEMTPPDSVVPPGWEGMGHQVCPAGVRSRGRQAEGKSRGLPAE